MDAVRVRVVIEGRVQGVWFRDSTRKEALSLGVSGWVKNRRDGGVEALLEGPRQQVHTLIDWCRHGPPAARVTSMHASEEEWTGELSSFEITF